MNKIVYINDFAVYYMTVNEFEELRYEEVSNINIKNYHEIKSKISAGKEIYVLKDINEEDDDVIIVLPESKDSKKIEEKDEWDDLPF